MKKILALVCLLYCLAAGVARAEDGYYHISPGMEDPLSATYAFAGFYYDPVTVMDDYGKFVFDGPSKDAKVMDEKYFDTLKDQQREKELPLALSEAAKDLKLNCRPVTLSDTQKSSLEKSLTTDLSADPDLVVRIAGKSPYVLAAVVDRYGELRGEGQIKVRTRLEGKSIDFLGRRSVLDLLPPEGQGWRRVTALTLVAFSAKDGHVVWQANECQTIQKIIFNDQKGCARDCLENIFKRLEDRWKKLPKETVR